MIQCTVHSADIIYRTECCRNKKLHMDAVIPSWFPADQIYPRGDHWFIGGEESLHIGPYKDKALAESKSKQFCARFAKLFDDGERMRYVRKVLSDEWAQIGPDATLQVEEIALEEILDPVRQGEAPKQWYRSVRFFQVDGVWFFSTREGIDVGPFETETYARHQEQGLKSLLIRTKSSEQARLTVMEFKHHPVELDPARVQIQGMRQFYKQH